MGQTLGPVAMPVAVLAGPVVQGMTLPRLARASLNGEARVTRGQTVLVRQPVAHQVAVEVEVAAAPVPVAVEAVVVVVAVVAVAVRSLRPAVSSPPMLLTQPCCHRYLVTWVTGKGC